MCPRGIKIHLQHKCVGLRLALNRVGTGAHPRLPFATANGGHKTCPCYATATMMTFDDDSKRTFCGICLFAIQADLSIGRGYADLDGLRAFYKGKENPRELAVCVTHLDQYLRKINGGTFRLLLRKNPVRTCDLWLMSRLLFDFAEILEGACPSPIELGCLRYCLGVMSSRFYKVSNIPARGVADRLNHFNKNDWLPDLLDIKDLIGEDWQLMP